MPCGWPLVPDGAVPVAVANAIAGPVRAPSRHARNAQRGAEREAGRDLAIANACPGVVQVEARIHAELERCREA